MENESLIHDLKEELCGLRLQVALLQKTITALGGEYEPNYCGCCMSIADESCDVCYSHLDKYLSIMVKRRVP